MDNLSETWEYFAVKACWFTFISTKPASSSQVPSEAFSEPNPWFPQPTFNPGMAAGMRGPPAASFWLRSVASLCLLFCSSSDTSSNSPTKQKHTPNEGMSISETKSKADPQLIEEASEQHNSDAFCHLTFSTINPKNCMGAQVHKCSFLGHSCSFNCHISSTLMVGWEHEQ